MKKISMNEKWKETIKERREVVVGCGEYPNDKLLLYADDEINRLKTLCDSLRHRNLIDCSITEYLKELSLDQLECCIENANKLIDKIKDQDKIKIWIVTVDDMHVGSYKECDYEKATSKLIDEIKSETELHKNHILGTCNISKRMIYESELEEYMEWNDL